MAMDEFFRGQPVFGPEAQDLVAMLRSPAAAAPRSLSGQLEYIRTKWGSLLGDLLLRLLTGNITNDLWHAAQKSLLARSLRGIFWFRWMQFWGTYQGYRQSGPLTWQLRQTFYYPRGMGVRPEARAGREPSGIMGNQTAIAAIVPMRHHSQRVPGKNYRLLAGKPLFHYVIDTLLRVPQISQIVVDTDSDPVMEGLQEHFPTVVIINRAQHLRGDDVPMNEILAHDTGQVEAEFYLQTHSTNPLLKAETISTGIERFLRGYPGYDTLFSVTRLQTRLYDQLGRALNHNPAVLLQTQELPPVYEENSCLYIFTREILLSRRNRLGERPLMFEIDPAEAWDIDDELDFEITAFLMGRK
jgi:CMP-N-acetylneuraminic acid synthetase